MKATHTGHCQACGRQQMLLNGQLSKHGYTVQWGFFEGVCPGSHRLPFELSCDYVKETIIWAGDKLAGVIKYQAEIRQPATTNKAFVHEYRMSRQRGQRSGYIWREVEIIETPHKSDNFKWTTYHYIDLDGKPSHKIDCYGPAVDDEGYRIRPSAKNMTEACNYLNEQKAKSLDRDIAEITKYIAWQTKRVETWQLAELTPVKPT